MKTVIVIAYQSLFDLAIRHYGSVLAVFDIALANGLAITEQLEPGRQIVLPDIAPRNRDVADYFDRKQITTGSRLDEDVVLHEGIDYWAVGFDFVVQ